MELQCKMQAKLASKQPTSCHLTILRHLGFQVFTAVVTNVAILWDILLCSPHVNRRFGGKYHLHLQGRNSEAQKPACIHLLHDGFLLSQFSILKIEKVFPSETSVHMRTTRHYLVNRRWQNSILRQFIQFNERGKYHPIIL
jgi:hypothetical protein